MEDLNYSYIQAAQIVGESDTTLRYWVNELKPIVNTDDSVNNKVFRYEDIDKLINIKKMIRVDGFTLSDVRDYYNNKKEVVVQNRTELATKSFFNELELRMNSFKDDILNEQKDMMLKLLDGQIKLNDDLVAMISSVNEMRNDELYEKIESKQNEVVRVSKFNAELIREQLEARRQEANKPWYLKLKDKLK